MRRHFSSEQIIALVMIVIVAGSGVALAATQLGRQTKRAFLRPASGAYVSPEERELKRLQGLKTKDTDGDGLSDYDEQYVYHTSAYLEACWTLSGA